MGNLITEVRPETLVAYGKKRVAFYDKVLFKGKEKGDVETLYIYVEHPEDGNKTIVRKAAGEQKVRNNFGDLTVTPETKLYARAYSKYLEAKNNIIANPLEEKVAKLEAELARKDLKELKKEKEEDNAPVLELKKESKEEKIEISEKKDSEKTKDELKSDLDKLGVKYTVNATKEALLELLYNNKE